MTADKIKAMTDEELGQWIAQQALMLRAANGRIEEEQLRADANEQRTKEAENRVAEFQRVHRDMRAMVKANNDVVDWAKLEATGLQHKTNNLLSRLEEQQAKARGREVTPQE